MKPLVNILVCTCSQVRLQVLYITPFSSSLITVRCCSVLFSHLFLSRPCEILKYRQIDFANQPFFSGIWSSSSLSKAFPLIFHSKATTLDRLYGPAWLAFGHSFAAEGEHDQAMAAYFKASQVMKG